MNSERVICAVTAATLAAMFAGCGEETSTDNIPVAAENTETRCQDGLDNDNNGKIDCDDPGCAEFSFCQKGDEGEENTLIACQDKIDNDGDGLIDCDDPDCKIFVVCKTPPAENTPALCSDGTDNDADGLIDCDDPDCIDFDHCKPKENTQALCSDGIDNDADGLADCDDPDCIDFDHCKPKENTQALCSDETDNDGDTLIDCDDPDCLIFDHCIAYRIAENSPELCSDGIDNDADGVKDCDALSCRHYDVCMGGGKVGEDTLEKCSDGIDNDGDTLVDCNDVECKEFQHCLGIKSPDISKETCESGIDADGDGLVGCADPDCQQFTDICSDLCPDDPYKYAPDKCPCGKTWVEDASFPEGGACFINISTPEEFARIAEVKPEDVEAGIAQGWGQSDNYILKRSIDFGETSSYVPAREFEGILEGNNKRIAGVFAFDGSKFEEYQKFGLFQRTETATFRNMILGITLNIANAPQYTSAGALMGTTGGSAHLENITGISKVYVKVKNKLAIPQNYNKMIDIKVGGLAGSLDGADTLHNVYLHGSNTTVEIDITQIFDNDKCTETKISNYFYYTCTLDASEKTINVGGIAGNSSLIDAENVHAFTNVTLISNLDLTTYEKYHYGDTFGPQSFKPIEFRVGGIAGTGYDLENFHSSGTISVNTNTKIDQSSHIYSSKKYIYAASTTRVGGIAGFSSNISDSSFSGDIIVAADDERSDNNYNYGNIESKADGYACVGGIVGGAANYGYNDAVFNGLYAKGNISIEPKCKSNSYENSVPTYGGGIIGCAFSDQNAYIINSHADMALTLEPSSCAKDTFRWGGIVSVMPRPQNASKQYKQYIVNNHAYTTFRFPQWGKYENVSLGGITSTNSDGYIVNNFVSGSFSGDETHENMAFYKAKLNATRGKYLYESYWNAAVYGDSAKSSGSQITDGSAKPFTFNAAKIPVISTNETVLGLLSANSGHNGGVLSANIPRFKDDAELYADWKAIADKDGNQIPVPISKTGKY